MPPNPRKASEIIEAVSVREGELQELHQRFRDDYERYRLTKFDAGEERQSFTTNAPRVLVNKLKWWMIDSKMSLNIPQHNTLHHERDVDQDKERFQLWMFRMADRRLKRQIRSSVKGELAFQILVRGHYCYRALLRNVEDGPAFPDITPWDPLHVTYEIGDQGLLWACYKTKQTAAEIRSRWGVNINADTMTTPDMGIEVYDFYDGEFNRVIAEGEINLKSAIAHGSPRIPIGYGVAGDDPMLQDGLIDDLIADWGESVFAENRGIWDEQNFVTSVRKELVSRQRDQALVLTSRGGDVGVEEDPRKTGKILQLEEGTTIGAMPEAVTTKDADLLSAEMAGEAQRGGLPNVAYGELGFSISGFAINSLGQSIQTPLSPRLSAFVDAHMGISEMFAEQYATGRFGTIPINGRDLNGDAFAIDPSPQAIAAACEPDIKFVAQLPRDDTAAWQNAQIARSPDAHGIPLLDDQSIREEILDLQDSDDVNSKVTQQMGSRLLPQAAMWDIVKASVDQGDLQGAEVYMAELQQMYMKEQLETQQLQIQNQQLQTMLHAMQQNPELALMAGAGVGGPGGGQPGPGGQGGPPGRPAGPGSPQMPQQRGGAGQGPPRMPPQNPGGLSTGPFVAPGTPRPGGSNSP